MAQKINPKQIEQAGATQGQALVWDQTAQAYIPTLVQTSPSANAVNFTPIAQAPNSTNVQSAVQELADFLFCLANS